MSTGSPIKLIQASDSFAKKYQSINALALSASILPSRKCRDGEGVSWRIGAHAYKLPFSAASGELYRGLGTLLRKYHDALEALYREDYCYAARVDFYRADLFKENVIRGADLQSAHVIYRPDLVLAENREFRLAEVDALPGEIGINCFLHAAYDLPSSGTLVASFSRMLEYLGLSDRVEFVIDAISAEDEYIAEYSYFAARLKEVGVEFSIHRFADYRGPSTERTFVYRFFDMVHNSQEHLGTILDAIRQTKSFLYPPLKHFLEEKLSLSYIHDVQFQDFLLRFFSPVELEIFRTLVPPVHYIEKSSGEVSPPVEVDGVLMRKLPELLAAAPNLPFILKTSGFSDAASTSKGIVALWNKPRRQVEELINTRLNSFNEHFVLQKAIRPLRIETEVMGVNGDSIQLMGYSRLTPFYLACDSHEPTLVSAHIVVRPDADDVHFAADATVLPAHE